MIITRTPLRVSFFGGGTDYPAWFREHGGAVLATTIDKYLYLHCRYLPPFFDFKSRIVWSKIEQVQQPSEIAHPAIRGVLEWMKIDEGVEIHHHGDLPARTGLGSSSSFSVGLLHALHALRGELVSKRKLAEEAIFVEQQVLQENVGVQDQIQSAFGGLNRIDIRTDGSFEVTPLVVRAERLAGLQKHLLLLYTGLSRTASEIAAEQVATVGSKTAELKAMREMVDQGEKILVGNGDLREFGRLLRRELEAEALALQQDRAGVRQRDLRHRAPGRRRRRQAPGRGRWRLHADLRDAGEAGIGAEVAAEAAAGAVPVRAQRHADRALRAQLPERPRMSRTRVLVCGATGFIGRNLVETLSRRSDLEVHAVRFTRPEYPANVTWHQADLRDAAG